MCLEQAVDEELIPLVLLVGSCVLLSRLHDCGLDQVPMLDNVDLGQVVQGFRIIEHDFGFQTIFGMLENPVSLGLVGGLLFEAWLLVFEPRGRWMSPPYPSSVRARGGGRLLQLLVGSFHQASLM